MKKEKHITVFAPIDITDVSRDAGGVRVSTQDGVLGAKLLVSADGRDSRLRRGAGITVQRFDYDAASLVTTISHSLPHDGLAWQRFMLGGPLAVLPLTGQRSQIVWSGKQSAIKAAAELPEEDFISLLSEKMDGYLGQMQCLAPRRFWPLRLQVADAFSAERLALLGDAAHVIHPLAGQGFNLGVRDAAHLAESVANARNTGQDVGVAGLIDYDLSRNADIRSMGAATHGLAMLYNVKGGVISHLRRVGLSLTNQLSPLKSAFEKQAAGEARDLPTLMR